MEKIRNQDYKVGNLIYDANIYDGLNTFLSDFNFYKNWMPKKNNADILELCCGTGRLTLPLAKEGLKISGVDHSNSMLQHARDKARNANLNVNFIEADIRNLDLNTTFDLIFIPFNSIHHLYNNQDLFDTFRMVEKHLKDDGLFLFDCFNPNIQYITAAEKVKNKVADYITVDDRKVIVEQTMKYESDSQVNRIEWHYFINDVFHSTQNLDMRLYFPQELDTYLKWSGYTILHKFGNFEEDKFNDKSEKQIFVCSKSKNINKINISV